MWLLQPFARAAATGLLIFRNLLHTIGPANKTLKSVKTKDGAAGSRNRDRMCLRLEQDTFRNQNPRVGGRQMEVGAYLSSAHLATSV